MNNLDKINELNTLLLNWNMSNKSQRFGQFIESNSSIEVGDVLYNSEDSYYVYSEIITKFEK